MSGAAPDIFVMVTGYGLGLEFGQGQGMAWVTGRWNVSERQPSNTLDHSTVDLPAELTMRKSINLSAAFDLIGVDALQST